MESPDMTVSPQTQETLRAFYALLHAPDRATLDRIVDAEVVVDDAPIGWTVKGKEELWSQVSAWAQTARERSAAGPDQQRPVFELLEFIGDDSRAAVPWRW